MTDTNCPKCGLPARKIASYSKASEHRYISVAASPFYIRTFRISSHGCAVGGDDILLGRKVVWGSNIAERDSV